ncbi:MAG: hypothetical protein KKE42_10950 [Alphaproteobacteria bacterium]|uniref:hypothetical protein n=1 Tax=Brevundimonas sp. TaxID=1871086 RepID=UPI0017A989B0|nr:hypothetical protein [Brevundimonas sp.]MBU3970622.1 hypothetical protein [Alphaproteobacteria bacterium]MBA3050500.1 hypothetical protein [Brevundimonas sp.]MBU3974301.1 hypothetical protein [Alphaproteobacteria bacterium]MBU4039136.1 hypothetical protein [Alphaproteobacteria bacterium]MBU4135119.1 hypothetical protein [Alphaproteobacteria bacterium]
MSDADRIEAALDVIGRYGQTDGAHHKAWVLDQAVRLLLGCPVVRTTLTAHNGTEFDADVVDSSPAYRDWVRDMQAGEDGPDTYDYDEGIAP